MTKWKPKNVKGKIIGKKPKDYTAFEKLLTESFGKPEREFRFHPDRMWRFDFAWPEYKVYIEIDGGLWNGGAHSRGTGILDDMEKLNEASILKWSGLRFEPSQLMTLKCFDTIKRLIESKINNNV